MPDVRLLRVRVSLKGRPVRSYRFSKELITVGRNPDADVSLDNAGISRDHLIIERSPDGSYSVQDQESANGTFVNDVQVTKQYLSNEDVIRIGKYSLWISYEDDRRAIHPTEVRLSPVAFEGTTVLKTSELQEMMESARETEPTPPLSLAIPRPAAVIPKKQENPKVLVLLSYLLTLAIGCCLGGGLFFLLLMQMRTG
jgi:pSer/pThr/pTyr-binding forkhead associated (FHA) protein